MHCVDLGESFPTSIYLQKSASTQPRTSPSKFGGNYSILFNRVLRCDWEPGPKAALKKSERQLLKKWQGDPPPLGKEHKSFVHAFYAFAAEALEKLGVASSKVTEECVAKMPAPHVCEGIFGATLPAINKALKKSKYAYMLKDLSDLGLMPLAATTIEHLLCEYRKVASESSDNKSTRHRTPTPPSEYQKMWKGAKGVLGCK